MSRRLFFIIVAILAALFGLFMLLAPQVMASNVGFEQTPQLLIFIRGLGATITSLAVLNFLVRNEPDSGALAAVLWCNVATHLLTGIVDFFGPVSGILTVGAVAPGMIVHLFVLGGSLYYISRMRA